MGDDVAVPPDGGPASGSGFLFFLESLRGVQSIKLFNRITISGLADWHHGGQVWDGTRGALGGSVATTSGLTAPFFLQLAQ